jgi:hypothetical protein
LAAAFAVLFVVPAAFPTALPLVRAAFATAGDVARTVVSITGAAVAAVRNEFIAFSANARRA